MTRLAQYNYLTLKQYRLLSGEENSMCIDWRGGGMPKTLRKLFDLHLIDDVRRRGRYWFFRVTEAGMEEAEFCKRMADRYYGEDAKGIG